MTAQEEKIKQIVKEQLEALGMTPEDPQGSQALFQWMRETFQRCTKINNAIIQRVVTHFFLGAMIIIIAIFGEGLLAHIAKLLGKA